MRRIRLLIAPIVALQFSCPIIHAETSLDALEDELKQVQQQHDDASSKQLTDLMSALDQAIQSPDKALELYQSAGGTMPPPSPVYAMHDTETPDEEAARKAQDQAVDAALASVVQLHCGLMHFAALFIQDTPPNGLHDAWIAWLKQAAQLYPQAGMTPPDNRPKPPTPTSGNDANGQGQEQSQARRNRQRQREAANPADFVLAFKKITISQSVISTYFSYHAWDKKEQGGWSVREIPRLYHTEILNPLRAKPNADTLAAWDTYIAMRNADAIDRDKWTSDEYPDLEFQRGTDDFYGGPTEEKLEALLALAKQNPNSSNFDNWITQTKQMIDDYVAFKKTGNLPPPPMSASAPGA